MNGKKIVALVALIIFIDQALKFYIKLNYFIGEEHAIIGTWARLHFVENEGMAWGLKWGGNIGKIALTLFRLVAVIWGVFLIKGFVEKKYHNGFLFCAALIFAGALGNLIDSIFYGVIFEASVPYNNHGRTTFSFGRRVCTFITRKSSGHVLFSLDSKRPFPILVPYLGRRGV